MEQLHKFVDDAHAKGWDDERIRQTLSASGWQHAQIDAALSGLDVPLPPTAPQTQQAPAVTHGAHSSIPALQAALQHVLLWVFTFSSTVMINIVAFALFGNGGGSSESLLTYVVLELVTFTPFLLLYLRYFRQLKKQPELTTGRVWSIITIVFHSIGLIGSVIAFILVLILVHNNYFKGGLIASGVIAAMNALVVTAYVLANFAKNRQHKLRYQYLKFFPLLLFILIAALGITALVRVGPLRADDQTKQNLSNLTQKVHDYTTDHNRLPSDLSAVPGAPEGITYQRLSSYSYKLCGTFKTDHSAGYDYGSGGQDDSYSDPYLFDHGSKGNNCWTLYNSDLKDQATNLNNNSGATIDTACADLSCQSD